MAVQDRANLLHHQLPECAARRVLWKNQQEAHYPPASGCCFFTNLRRVRPRGGKSNRKSGSLTFVPALDFDGAVMQLDQMFHNGKA